MFFSSRIALNLIPLVFPQALLKKKASPQHDADTTMHHKAACFQKTKKAFICVKAFLVIMHTLCVSIQTETELTHKSSTIFLIPTLCGTAHQGQGK